MTCILKRNPLSGFASQHTSICPIFGCEEPATRHVSTDGYCGNRCEGCAKRFAKVHPKSEITEGVYVEATVGSVK